MTPEQIRLAMAEVDGWELAGIWWTHPSHPNKTIEAPPDYPNDLNAAHEVKRKVIQTEDQQLDFILKLTAITKAFNPDRLWQASWLLIDASALQVCEAILRTLGKWKDND